MPKSPQPRFRKGSAGTSGEAGTIRIVGRLAIMLITKKVGKLRASTDAVRPNTRPTRKSFSTRRPAGKEISVIDHPLWQNRTSGLAAVAIAAAAVSFEH